MIKYYLRKIIKINSFSLSKFRSKTNDENKQSFWTWNIDLAVTSKILENINKQGFAASLVTQLLDQILKQLDKSTNQCGRSLIRLIKERISQLENINKDLMKKIEEISDKYENIK